MNKSLMAGRDSEGVLIRRFEPQIPLGGLVDTRSSIRRQKWRTVRG